jgi:hypothetical protein
MAKSHADSLRQMGKYMKILGTYGNIQYELFGKMEYRWNIDGI